MLRNTRIILALVFLSGITLLFAGIGQDWWGWMAKLQFLPSVFRILGGFTLGNAAILAALIILTLVFGRIYCSVICPMGVFQDVIIWLRRQLGLLIDKLNFRNAKGKVFVGADGKPVRLKPVVKHFSYSPERKWARYIVLAAVLISVFVCGQLLISLIAPYSAYGRMVSAVVSLAGGGAATALLITAAATFAVIGISAWIWGRAWCNTICPVGTILGYISKAALFKIRIDADKCKACGRCGRGCKSSCIDMDAHKVDYSRCIDCFDCIRRCKEGAISFSSASGKATDSGRRKFLGTTAMLAGAAVTAKAQEMKLDGGLAPLKEREDPRREERLVPPGAWSVKSFYEHCTACQLCVSSCPNGVLKPSTDLEHLLQPQMTFTEGYCRPECTECSDICPAGAIRPIQRDEKSSIKIGTAKVNPEFCLAANGEAGCGNCERHCPTGAIRMVNLPNGGGRRPVVMEELCIGCGACEHLCPARPVSAITVEGLSVHQKK